MYRNNISLHTSFASGYSPRSSLRLLMTDELELLNKISLGFDRYILHSLKPRFHDRGLSEIEFIQVLLKGLDLFNKDLPQRELRLVNSISTIFQDITMGQPHKVTWEMFSNYLINNVRHIKNKQEPPFTYSKTNLNNKIKFLNPICKVVYVKGLQLLMMCEENSNKVHVVDPKKGILMPQCLENEPRKLSVETSVVKKENGKSVISNKEIVIPTEVIIMEILYLHEAKFDVLLCSTSDGCVKGWKYTLNGFQLAAQPESSNLNISHSFPSPIYSLAWDQTNYVLYCGSQKGPIYSWSFKTDSQHPLESGHDSMVMCMCYISKLQMLVSGGMDGKLIMWDIVSGNKKAYKYHSRGILVMVVSQVLMLYTGGFDHQICVWNPYISGLVHRINIHSATILSLGLVNHYLVSMDSENSLKITNTKNFEHVFTIPLAQQRSKSNYSAMTLVDHPNRIVVCSNTIDFYDYDQDKNADLADNIPIQGTFYVESNLKLYAWNVDRIKVWNMLTGELEESFQGLCGSQISCVLYEQTKQHILVGDISGHLNLLNYKSCLKIKELPRQPFAVDFMLPIKAIKENDLLAIISGYSIVNIYKVTPEGYQLTKTFQVAKNTQITYALYNESSRQLVFGTNFGSIEFYDVESGKMIKSTTTLDMYSNIVTVQIVNRAHMLLIEASFLGNLSIVRNLPDSLERVYSTKVMDVDNKVEPFRINAACWDKERMMFLADEKGNVVGCNFGLLLAEYQYTLGKLSKGIQILWKVKAHQEASTSLTYITKEKLLVSTSFDKRLKMWNSETGDTVDYLRQQLYYNQTATPLYYWSHEDGKYDIRWPDFTPATLKHSPIDPPLSDLVFNPKWLLDSILLPKANNISNRYWKVNVKFLEKCKARAEKISLLVKELESRRKSNKFQLILKREPQWAPEVTLRNELRLSLTRHVRQSSALSLRESPKKRKEYQRLERPPKLDKATRAEKVAHKNFQKDIAMIDNELKHQGIRNNRSHESLNLRKSMVLTNTSRHLITQEPWVDKKNMISLSQQSMSALNRLSQALSLAEEDKTPRLGDALRIKKIDRR